MEQQAADPSAAPDRTEAARPGFLPTEDQFAAVLLESQ
jgi:hypothetical protein